MLLVQLTLGGSTVYVSNDYHDIEHFYDAYVAGLSQLRVATREIYGGFAEPSFGEIDFLPSVFPSNWVPPMSIPIIVKLGVTGEADAETLFEGTAYQKSIGRDSIKYDLYGPESYATTVVDGVYDGTLNAVFTTACSTLGLTLNTTYARATSPAVKYTATGEQKIIDNLSEIAAFFTHRFYIQSGTLYLIDCLLDNGSVLALTEFDIFPSNYTTGNPYKKFQAKYTPAISKYRFVFSDVQYPTDVEVGVAEIAFMQVQDGTDETTNTGGTATAKDYYSPYIPVYAVDNDAGTFWLSGTNVSTLPWWQFDFNSPVKILEYTIQGLSAGGNNSPTAWKVQGWDADNSAFRTIKDEVSDPDWTAGEVRKFSLPIPEWEVTVAGSYPFGDVLDVSPVCHTDLANIQTALANIKTVVERRRVELIKPLSGVPKIGQKITLTDESLLVSTAVWARVSSVVWDFDQEQCVVEGEGELT